MSIATLAPKEVLNSAGMTEIVFLRDSEKIRCVVGSCIALTLYHSRQKLGALVHIVLPHSSDPSGPPGKYADTAIPHIVDALSQMGANQAGLVAKMCGGASMFGSNGPIQIGQQNIEAVAEILKHRNIPVVGEHLAGPKGRRITFHCQTGEVSIEIAGQTIEVL